MKPYTFIQQFEIQTDDLDTMQHVNNVRYVQWVQDVAEAHWKQQASEEMQQQYTWVVLSHHIEYRHPLFLTDPVLLKTQVGDRSGAKYGRNVEIWNSQKDILSATAESTWCLLDAQTQRPTRVTDEIRLIFEAEVE